jgi:hypothetical protein
LKSRRRALSIASAYSRGLVLLVPLNLLYLAFSGNQAGDGIHDLVSTLAPLYFMSILVWLSYRAVKRAPEAIWSAAFWLPLQSAVFFGFGPLVEVFGNEVTQYSLATHNLAITSQELFHAHQLSTLGVTLLLFGFGLHMRFYPRVWRNDVSRSQSPVIRPETLGLVFILVGGIFKYMVLKPAQWGMIDIAIAGVLSGLGAIVDVGLGILAYVIASGKSRLRPVFWLLWPLHLFLSCLSFSKLEIGLALLLPAIGAFIAHRSMGRLVAWFAVMAFVFYMAQPWVHYGRAEVMEASGVINEAGYLERIEILGRYLSKTRSVSIDTEQSQGWWTRLSFAGPQAYAMNAHDVSLSGASLSTVWMYFVPRAIWPEKPIMTGPGLEFYRLVTGHDEGQSFLALSIYGDLYWQFGWLGVILGCPLIGWVFAMMALRSITAIKNREFIMIPAVLFALEMAMLGPNKYVINGIIGSLPIYVAYLVAANLVLKHLQARGSAKPTD